MTTRSVAELWLTKHSVDWGYFDNAEADENTPLWRETGPFVPLFNSLDLTAVLEIACGKGRHASHCVDRAGTLHLVDTSGDAVKFAKQRFAGRRNVKVHLSRTGVGLPFIKTASLTAVYSYDAMVHFEVETMASYLNEIGRVLRPGGKALLHHSNSSDDGLLPLTKATGWRNYMTADLFAHLAARGGLTVVQRHEVSWARAGSDAITLLVKPQA